MYSFLSKDIVTHILMPYFEPMERCHLHIIYDTLLSDTDIDACLLQFSTMCLQFYITVPVQCAYTVIPMYRHLCRQCLYQPNNGCLKTVTSSLQHLCVDCIYRNSGPTELVSCNLCLGYDEFMSEYYALVGNTISVQNA
jgi:hypothetical protein